jgi:hypothetical protein
MKNLFLISRTFDVVTPESAQEGDIADSGFIFKDRPATLRECLDEVKTLGGIDYHDGENFYPCDSSVDYCTGESTREFVHIRALTPSAGRAWNRALAIVNL